MAASGTEGPEGAAVAQDAGGTKEAAPALPAASGPRLFTSSQSRVAGGSPDAALDDGKAQDIQPTTSVVSSQSRLLMEVAAPDELRAWYVYDWANSPFWQIVDTLGKVLMKRIAEFAADAGTYPADGPSPGSYPAIVLWFTAAVQVVALLSFSALGDFGNARKRLLMILTWVGSFFVLCMVFSFSSVLWWLPGVLRVLAGMCFILSNVYYNSYLPLLAEAHHEVKKLTGHARVQKVIEVQDHMSNFGYLLGFAGGLTAQVVVFFVFLFVECDPQEPECAEDETSRLMWISLVIGLAGLWWAGFSIYPFMRLKARPGPPLPVGENIYCLGWKQAGATARLIFSFKHLLRFVVGYFIWSDSLATTLNLAILVLDDEDGSGSKTPKDSAIVFNLTLGVLGGIVGVFLTMKIQQCFKATNKTVMLWELCIFCLVTGCCAGGVLTKFGNIGFYLAMAPITLMFGSLQSLQRALFSNLTPLGKEAAMFAFFAITDKGSSLIGTAVIAIVHSSTGSYLPAFVYCSVAYGVSAVILYYVDVQEGLADAGKMDMVEAAEKPAKDEASTAPPPSQPEPEAHGK